MRWSRCFGTSHLVHVLFHDGLRLTYVPFGKGAGGGQIFCVPGVIHQEILNTIVLKEGIHSRNVSSISGLLSRRRRRRQCLSLLRDKLGSTTQVLSLALWPTPQRRLPWSKASVSPGERLSHTHWITSLPLT